MRQRRGSPARVPGRCGGKLALTDPPRYCLQWPLRGRKTCKFHGGHTPVGDESPRFKHGHYSRFSYLSPQVAQAADQLLGDESIMDLQDDVVLLEMLKREAAQAADLGASPEAWARARELAAALGTAEGADRDRLLHELLAALEGDRASAGDRLAAAIERKSRLVGTRHRLMVESEDLIPAKRVRIVLAGISALVKEFIPDEEQRREFKRRFLGFVGTRLRPPDRAGDGADAGDTGARDLPAAG